MSHGLHTEHSHTDGLLPHTGVQNTALTNPQCALREPRARAHLPRSSCFSPLQGFSQTSGHPEARGSPAVPPDAGAPRCGRTGTQQSCNTPWDTWSQQSGALRVLRLSQGLLHLLWLGQASAAALRVAVSQVLQLQVLRQGVCEPGRLENAHTHTHAALCLQALREGLLQAMATTGAYSDTHR